MFNLIAQFQVYMELLLLLFHPHSIIYAVQLILKRLSTYWLFCPKPRLYGMYQILLLSALQYVEQGED